MRATYEALIDGISDLGLAYLSVLHGDFTGELVQDLRARFGGKVIANTGFGAVTSRDEATELISGSHADAIAVGRLVISNPDLAARWAQEAPENEPDAALFYTPGARGYTDYPTLASA